MKRDVLLFDLDGTLTDPKLGIVRCIRFALEELQVACPDDDNLTAFIGPSLRGTFASLLATADALRIEQALTIFRRRFSATGLFENRVYDGVPAMLERAGNAFVAMYVATSKPALYAERIVKHFGLDEHFRKVYGAELDGRYDDKAELLAHILRTENVAPDTAVMIGDRDVDVRAAKANGLLSIGVLWGYGSEDELVRAGADILCRTPLEAADQLSNIAA